MACSSPLTVRSTALKTVSVRAAGKKKRSKYKSLTAQIYEALVSFCDLSSAVTNFSLYQGVVYPGLDPVCLLHTPEKPVLEMYAFLNAYPVLVTSGRRDILKKANLGDNGQTESTLQETKQTFYQPGGELAEMTIAEATAQFMNENYPKFGEESLSFPEQIVDYGLSTQALLLSEKEFKEFAISLESTEMGNLRNQRTHMKGAEAEIKVVDFVNKSKDEVLMATFWSYNQSSLQKLMGTQQRNQEMDVIILLAKQRKFIVIEVKSDHSGRVPSNALTTLEKAKTFADQVFKILGIRLLEHWEFLPLVALPNVKHRDMIEVKDRSHLKYILTETELKSDLLNVMQIKRDEYEDVSSYKQILSLLAASYHSTTVKKGSIGGVQFEIRNLALEANRKLVGEEQLQAGFDGRERIKDTVSLTDLKNEPLAGFKGFMFWNRKQMDILLNMKMHEKEGLPCFIAGAWGTGKTLLLAYKAITLSSEGKKVVFISNLDCRQYVITRKHYVFEEKIRIDFESNENISFYTMKDIVKNLKGQFAGNLIRCVRRDKKTKTDHCSVEDRHNVCIMIQFMKELSIISYHLLIDELEVDYNSSILAELQAVKLDSRSLTIAMRGETRPSHYKKLDSEPIVLNKIMRMCSRIYNEVTPPPDFDLKPWMNDVLVKNSTVQHTVLGCKLESIKVSESYELFSIGLKKALPMVASHPVVVVLCCSGEYDIDDHNDFKFVYHAVKTIRANSNKPVIAFTGESSQLDELIAFLRRPSGFLVTTPELYSGMEATSVIVIWKNEEYSVEIAGLNGLCTATTRVINIYEY